jgi:hypothetical protein
VKKRYLAVYDYGMGGVSGYVLASSADEITDRYPEVEVVEHEPAWMSEIREGLERRVEDLDDPRPLGLLSVILRTGIRHNTRRTPTGYSSGTVSLAASTGPRTRASRCGSWLEAG